MSLLTSLQNGMTGLKAARIRTNATKCWLTRSSRSGILSSF